MISIGKKRNHQEQEGTDEKMIRPPRWPREVFESTDLHFVLIKHSLVPFLEVKPNCRTRSYVHLASQVRLRLLVQRALPDRRGLSPPQTRPSRRRPASNLGTFCQRRAAVSLAVDPVAADHPVVDRVVDPLAGRISYSGPASTGPARPGPEVQNKRSETAPLRGTTSSGYIRRERRSVVLPHSVRS